MANTALPCTHICSMWYVHIHVYTTIRVTDQAARSQGLNSALELTSVSPTSDPTTEKRPDVATASWPSGESLRVTGPATASPVSQSTPYSPTPTSIDPERLLKKRESKKTTEYRSLAQSQGGDFSPLVTGTSGYTTTSTKKVLQVVCSNQDSTDSSSSRYTCEFWMTKTSLSLQKSAASETLARSKKVSGKQYTSSPSRDTFPDSADIHFQVSG